MMGVKGVRGEMQLAILNTVLRQLDKVTFVEWWSEAQTSKDPVEYLKVVLQRKGFEEKISLAAWGVLVPKQSRLEPIDT